MKTNLLLTSAGLVFYTRPANVKSRKEAAAELLHVYNKYEVRPVKLATIYRRIWWDGYNWRLSARAHDYTC